MATWLYGENFTGMSDEQLVLYWNDGDGTISWRHGLQCELIRRGYEPRATDPGDPRPRIHRGEQVVLEVKQRG